MWLYDCENRHQLMTTQVICLYFWDISYEKTKNFRNFWQFEDDGIFVGFKIGIFIVKSMTIFG